MDFISPPTVNRHCNKRHFFHSNRIPTHMGIGLYTCIPVLKLVMFHVIFIANWRVYIHGYFHLCFAKKWGTCPRKKAPPPPFSAALQTGSLRPSRNQISCCVAVYANGFYVNFSLYRPIDYIIYYNWVSNTRCAYTTNNEPCRCRLDQKHEVAYRDL